tara:strand:- start:147 stop:458 length:312 start_codon:yes stop_codon:yes gene_type:complete
LASFESKTFSEPKRCVVLNKLTSSNREDCFLVELDNEIIDPLTGENLKELVIAGKFEPTTLNNSNQEVYILKVVDYNKIEGIKIQEGALQLLTEGTFFKEAKF